MAKLRGRCLKTKWIKPLETFAWAFVTASFFYWVPFLKSRCQSIDLDDDEELFKGWCVGATEKNGLATLFWNTEGGVIRGIMDAKVKVQIDEQILFFIVWYGFTITTYGTNVPAGLFLPGMIIGCILGQIYSTFLHDLNLVSDDNWDTYRKKNIVLGCAGFMAGYTRMTYSLAVILMETSQDMSLFVPMIFTTIISNQTGFRFTRSLYQRATRAKQMPIITDKIPGPCKNLKAGDVMAKNVICVHYLDTVANLKEVLQSPHHAYPVVNNDRQMIGIVPRNFIITLLNNEGFYGTEEFMVKNTSIIGMDAFKAENQAFRDHLMKKNKYVNKREDFTKLQSSMVVIQDTEEGPCHESRLLPWQMFTKEILGLDLKVSERTKEVIAANMRERIDFRPYMNDNPMTVAPTDSLLKCCELFRKMHLRHLMVINFQTGRVAGMITRQDLFTWLDL